jgi:hypothetical protein
MGLNCSTCRYKYLHADEWPCSGGCSSLLYEKWEENKEN